MKTFLSLLSVVCLLATGVYAGDKQQVVIIKVSDGDTVKAVMHNKKVTIRLANIDCPEIRTNDRTLKQAKQMNLAPESIKKYGKDAQKNLKKLLDFYENEIYFEETPENMCDGEERLVGNLFAGDVNVNEYMLKNSKCVAFSCSEE